MSYGSSSALRSVHAALCSVPEPTPGTPPNRKFIVTVCPPAKPVLGGLHHEYVMNARKGRPIFTGHLSLTILSPELAGFRMSAHQLLREQVSASSGHRRQYERKNRYQKA